MRPFLGPRLPSDEAREPLLRSPWAVNVLLLILIAVHVGSLFLSEATYEAFVTTFAMTPAQFAEGQDEVRAYWPFVSYAFLHGDFAHLAFNAMGLLIFGTLVARRCGLWRFAVLALITTVLAAVTHLICHWGSPVPVVGASGAVSGLLGASFRFIFLNPHTSAVWPPAHLPLFSRPVLVTSGVWILLNVGLGLIGFTPEGFGRMIAWEAHIGGFLAGLLLLPLFDRRRNWLS